MAERLSLRQKILNGAQMKNLILKGLTMESRPAGVEFGPLQVEPLWLWPC